MYSLMVSMCGNLSFREGPRIGHVEQPHRRTRKLVGSRRRPQEVPFVEELLDLCHLDGDAFQLETHALDVGLDGPAARARLAEVPTRLAPLASDTDLLLPEKLAGVLLNRPVEV